MNNSKKLFLLTDDPLLAALVRSSLSHFAPYQVLDEPNAHHALQALWAYRPDLIVIDLDPFGIDEGDLCAHLRGEAALSDLPTVLLSNWPDESSTLSRNERFLLKPLRPLDLLAVVGEMAQLKKLPDFSAATRAGAEILRVRNAESHSFAA